MSSHLPRTGSSIGSGLTPTRRAVGLLKNSFKWPRPTTHCTHVSKVRNWLLTSMATWDPCTQSPNRRPSPGGEWEWCQPIKGRQCALESDRSCCACSLGFVGAGSSPFLGRADPYITCRRTCSDSRQAATGKKARIAIPASPFKSSPTARSRTAIVVHSPWAKSGTGL